MKISGAPFCHLGPPRPDGPPDFESTSFDPDQFSGEFCSDYSWGPCKVITYIPGGFFHQSSIRSDAPMLTAANTQIRPPMRGRDLHSTLRIPRAVQRKSGLRTGRWMDRGAVGIAANGSHTKSPVDGRVPADGRPRKQSWEGRLLTECIENPEEIDHQTPLDPPHACARVRWRSGAVHRSFFLLQKGGAPRLQVATEGCVAVRRKLSRPPRPYRRTSRSLTLSPDRASPGFPRAVAYGGSRLASFNAPIMTRRVEPEIPNRNPGHPQIATD